MSITAESNLYESSAEDAETGDKLCLVSRKCNGEFIYMPKNVSDVDDTMMDVSDDESDRKHGIFDDRIRCAARKIESSSFYYNEDLETCQEVEIDYKPSLSSMMLSGSKEEDDWEETNQYGGPTMETSFEEDQIPKNLDDDDDKGHDSDEETIATFLTAAGQRLALYAVEDSDEVFAVAVYDESGEPPTNFQFLMKSDVERLIGEGAVRTVKKPSQMKSQILNSEPPIFADSKEEDFEQTEVDEIKPLEYQMNEQTSEKDETNKSEHLESEEIVAETEEISSPLPEIDGKISDTTMAESVITETTMETSVITEPLASHKLEECEENFAMGTMDDEFAGQTTVHSLFMDSEDSDDELTFADIEESLKIFTKNAKAKNTLVPSLTDSTITPQVSSIPESLIVHNNTLESVDISENSTPSIAVTPEKENRTIITINSSKKILRSTNIVRRTIFSSSLLHRRENNSYRQNTAGTSLLIGKNDSTSAIGSSESSDIVRTSSKAKRPRKQQLTSVNRGDSEIIIQPATFTSDEEETMRQGRRKRKSRVTPIYKMKSSVAKRVKRGRRRRVRARPIVEVIEIDVDEEDLLQRGETNIVEITIDENKEKGSSDKENEVIMVGDSDDEIEKAATSRKSSSSSLLKCAHCSRGFRVKRALVTHSRLCPKAPETIKRLEEKGPRRNTRRSSHSNSPKKEYCCKLCDEKFDIAVTLARHVKSMHPLRKRSSGQSETATKTNETSERENNEFNATGVDVTTRRKKRRRRRKTNSANRTWKSSKLHCPECTKWFSSAALLAAHSLQHATKKSEKLIHRCQTCKKILKTRLLYIRHMRMHTKAEMVKNKVKDQRTSVEISTIVRRGRSRTLKL